MDERSSPAVRPGSVAMSNADFIHLSRFIHEECGIKITETKKPMLEARLQKRLNGLGLASFNEYCDYLFSPGGMNEELAFMIDAVTTNKTDFFREPAHFRFLVESVLPEMIESYGWGVRRKLAVWSAGCSTGRNLTRLPWCSKRTASAF